MYEFVKKLARVSFVDEVWLYGSRARGDNLKLSDIDVAVVCPSAGDDEWSAILDVIAQANTLLKIDCVRYDVLEDGAFKNNVLNYRKILYAKKGEFMDKAVWKDSFRYLGDALDRLQEVLAEKDINTNVYLRDSTIQRFECSIELYWKVLKKILAYEKIEAQTPRDVMAKAFQFGFIEDQKVWIAMLEDRNNTSHVYKEDDAKKIFEHIKRYESVMRKTYDVLKKRLGYVDEGK